MEWWIMAQAVATAAGGIQIDWTISVGQIFGALITGVMAIIGAYGAGLKIYHAIDKRFTSVEATLVDHAQTLTDHSNKMADHEKKMVDVMQDVAKILGALDWAWAKRPRRRSSDS